MVQFDWFAIDSTGVDAWMMSAGYGPIPAAVSQRLEEQLAIEKPLTKFSGYSFKVPWPQMMWCDLIP